MTDAAREWNALVRTWSESVPRHGAGAEELRRLVVGQRRRMIIWTIGDVIASAGFIAAAIWVVARYPGAASIWLAANIVVLTAAIWTFTLWNRRGTWNPLGESTAMYLAIARLRCERRMRAVRLAAVAVAAQLIFVLTWRVWGPPIAADAWLPAILRFLPAFVVASFAIVLTVTWQWTKRELGRLEAVTRASTFD